MNEPTAIIPITHPAAESARALAWGMQHITGADLLRHDAAQLRALMRQLYQQAQQSGLLRELKQAVIECGKNTDAIFVWSLPHEGRHLVATLTGDNGLLVTLDNTTVLRDGPKLKFEIVFSPGEWLNTLLEACETERWQREQRNALAVEAARLEMVKTLKAGQ